MAEEKMVVEYKSQGGVDVRLTPNMVKQFLVQGRQDLVTTAELVYFMHTCRARKLNPFIKDCYLVKYDSRPAAIITAIGYFRKNARKAEDCQGWQAGIILKNLNGEIEYREGTLLLEGEELVGGWGEAKPEDWPKPKRHTVNLGRYIKRKKDGSVTEFWSAEKQPDMIMKVAEKQILDQIWGEETTGMYTPEEMPSLEDVKFEAGPVQSDIKQRIMDGVKKKADDLKAEPLEPETEAVKSEPPGRKLKAEFKPPEDMKHVATIKPDELKLSVQEDAFVDGMKAAIEKRKKPESSEPIPSPKPNEPNIKEPEQLEYTEDQIIATEKAFDILLETTEISRVRAYEYITHIEQIGGGHKIDIIKTIVEDPKTGFADIAKWVFSRGKPVTEKQNGGKKKVPLKDLPYNNEVWKPENWSKLKSSGFSTFVWKNVKTLVGEPYPLRKAVERKWNKLFKDAFPVAGANTINGNDNHIKAEVYHDPQNGNNKPALLPEDEDFQSPPQTPPDKEKDPVVYAMWLRSEFPEQYKNALDYCGIGDAPASISVEAVQMVIKNTERLIDMESEQGS